MKNSDATGGTMIERDLDDVPFTMIPNALLADTSISWKAKGVISYLLGKPAHWKARTKDIENHGTGGETEIRSALQELRTAGYARLERHTEKGRAVQFVLRVANKPKYTMDGGNRVDVPLDGDRPHPGRPDVENPHLDSTVVGAAFVENRDIRKKEGRKNDLQKKEKIEKSSSSNKVRAFGDGAADADPTPSAIVGPRSSAEKFIQDFKQWGRAARITATVSSVERASLQEFFSLNPEITPRELTALMLCAWIMPKDQTVAGTDYNPFWHCNHKSRKVSGFIEFIHKIQEETDWAASKMDKVYRLADQQFLQQKAA
jgi:hypothetical protein